MVGASTRSRLSLRAPNFDAKALFLDVKKQLQEEKSVFEKFCCLGAWGIIGLILMIVAFFTAEPWAAPIVLLIFIAIGTCCHFIAREDSFHIDDTTGWNKARLLLRDNLDSRIRVIANQWRSSIEPHRTNMDNKHGLVGSIVNCYTTMDAAGCVPPSALTTYAMAWSCLFAENESGHIQNLHEKWVSVVTNSTAAAWKVTQLLDKQRAAARKHALKNATSDSANIGAAVNSVAGLCSISGQAKAIKSTIQEIKQGWEDDENIILHDTEKTGIHAITKARLIFLVPFTGGLILLFTILFAALGSGLGAGVMAAIGALMVGLIIWVNMFVNKTYNALEDFVSLEVTLRSTLATETQHVLPGELSTALNTLRDQIMDAYYDSLGIHLQTEMLTFGDIPALDESDLVPFWSKQGGEGDIETTEDTSVDEAGVIQNTRTIPFADSYDDVERVNPETRRSTKKLSINKNIKAQDQARGSAETKPLPKELSTTGNSMVLGQKTSKNQNLAHGSARDPPVIEFKPMEPTRDFSGGKGAKPDP